MYWTYKSVWKQSADDNPGGVINQNMGYPGAENNIPTKTEITE